MNLKYSFFFIFFISTFLLKGQELPNDYLSLDVVSRLMYAKNIAFSGGNYFQYEAVSKDLEGLLGVNIKDPKLIDVDGIMLTTLIKDTVRLKMLYFKYAKEAARIDAHSFNLKPKNKDEVLKSNSFNDYRKLDLNCRVVFLEDNINDLELKEIMYIIRDISGLLWVTVELDNSSKSQLIEDLEYIKSIWVMAGLKE